jgi:hypothetical protein
MTPAGWHDENTRYLAAAIARIRSRLERSGGASASAPGPGAQPAEPSLWHRLSRRHAEIGAKAVVLLPAPDDAESLSGGTDAPPALVALRRRLGLSSFEQDVLLLCAAMELDTATPGHCGRIHGDPARASPTFALALALFEGAAWDALSPERPLRYWRLIEIHQPGGQPLTASPLRADEWVVNYLKGLDYLDDRLAPLLSRLAVLTELDEPPASQRRVAAAILDRVATEEPCPVVQLLGSDQASKDAVAGLVSDALGLTPYRLHWSQVSGAASDIETFARLWQRQALLTPVMLIVDGQEIAGEHAPAIQAGIGRLIAKLGGPVFLQTREPWPGLPVQAVSADVAKPTSEEQEAAWTAALGDEAGDVPARLAAQFNLGMAAIRAAAGTARNAAPDADALPDRAWAACLSATRPRLESLAQRVQPAAGWDALVLPPTETAQLREIAAQVGQRGTIYRRWGFAERSTRGLGISALFSGDSGVGKTLAAEVIATHLRLDLYRIDLSAVVSKYIGETEKNLRRLFDAAEDGGAILFFDEADALFGKRSEVKDSHDRYANIEVNYLLQRMETYGGLAILATNMKSALDPAFLRRLRFVVSFPFPGQPERRAIWERAFPPQTPVAGLDFDRLARLNLTGGHIALVALNAAFAAAAADSPVTMPIVLASARTEFRKLERPIHEPDFRWPVAPVRVA